MKNNIKLGIDLPVIMCNCEEDKNIYIKPYTVNIANVEYSIFEMKLLKFNNTLFPDWKGREEVENFIKRIDKRRRLPDRGTVFCCVADLMPGDNAWGQYGPWGTPTLVFLEKKPEVQIAAGLWHEGSIRGTDNMVMLGRKVATPYEGLLENDEKMMNSNGKYIYEIEKFKRKPSEEMIRLIYGPKYDLYPKR